MTRNKSAGFSLIEIMIVISVLGLIAAITIPNLRDARKNANETAAIAALKAIFEGQTMLRDRDLDGDGVQNYTDLPTLVARLQLDPQFLSTRSGYIFEVTRYDAFSFYCYCRPAQPGLTADRFFGIDESGQIYQYPSLADAQSETNPLPIGG